MNYKKITIFSLVFIVSFSQNILAYANDEELETILIPPSKESQQKILEQKNIVVKPKYMVSVANSHAAKAGIEMLKNGGSAVDAAIAIQMVLNLVEPQSSGIGGGGFMMHYDAINDNISSYDGRETAPSSATESLFLDNDGNPLPFFDAVKGGKSVGVPGLLRMLELAHKNQGKLPWKELFTPAIRLAENGFELSPRLHKMVSKVPYLNDFLPTASVFLDNNGKPKKVGTTIRNHEFAVVLKLIADKGADIFYNGEIAENIVSAVNNSPINAGNMSTEDISNYKAIEREPVCGTYREYKICSMNNPSSGGITLLQMLGILENFDIKSQTPFSVKAVHLISEASKLAFADRNKYLADSDFINVPTEKMLNKTYLKKRAKLINNNKTIEQANAGVFGEIQSTPSTENEGNSTTHISVIDADGNAVSMTSSIEYIFGSALSVRGFLLNNELTDFSFIPEKNGIKVANRVQALKRPRSSMTPTLIFNKDGTLFMAIGSPGGSRIIGYVLQTIIAAIDWGMPIEEAINLPHHINRGNKVELEKGTQQEYIAEALKLLGHKIEIRELESGLHGITVDKNGNLTGGADKRREGIVLPK